MQIASSSPFVDGLTYPSSDDQEIQHLKVLHPSDIAEILESSRKDALQIIETLLSIGNGKAVNAFGHLSIKTQKACLEVGQTRFMLKFIEGMSPDDRVDLLKSVDAEVFEAMMPLISKAERSEIQRLWDYAEGTAGAVMTIEYAFLPANISVRTALERLRLQAPDKETIYYIYITDPSRKLIGMLSLRDLILSKPNMTLTSVMETQVISVPHHMPTEEVAALISKYDFLALPVVDDAKHLLGIITIDDVVEIMKAENTEDFHKMSAVGPFEEKYFKRPLNRLFWNRFWWLAVLLFTSLLSTTIMELNRSVLQQMMALAFFIPMVTGTCGNAGTQSATMVVRALALGEVRLKDFGKVFRRELLMGGALGAALGIVAYFRVFLQDHNLLLAAIVGTALFGTLLMANLAGALIPLVLKRVKLDPALTAGPFIATIIDALGIALYFNIALILLRNFN